MEKIFLIPATNKQWRTCLNGGKVKELVCDSAFQVKSRAASGRNCPMATVPVRFT